MHELLTFQNHLNQPDTTQGQAMNDENANVSKFNLPDTLLRISGIFGFLIVLIGGFMIAGGNPLWLIHPAEIIIVFGITFFGLLSTHQANFLAYVPKALSACVVKPKANRDYCQISEHGRRYAAAGGGLAVMLGIINTMSNLEDPEMVGRKVAAAMSGVVVAVLVSQVFFVYLRHTFSEPRNPR